MSMPTSSNFGMNKSAFASSTSSFGMNRQNSMANKTNSSFGRNVTQLNSPVASKPGGSITGTVSVDSEGKTTGQIGVTINFSKKI